MSAAGPDDVGRILWVDLTVAEASRLRDFYRDVVGLQPSAVDMDGYDDYNMLPPGSEMPVCGVCHARGVNAGLPPVWMVYFTVADVDAAAAKCVALGGETLIAPRTMGGGRYCVIRDPAGAVCALYAAAPPATAP